MMTRRALLQTGGMMALTAGVSAPLFFGRAAQAATINNKVLVVVYQRFGMDGLLAVTPYANTSLQKLRPDLVLPAPDSGKDNALIELGDGFGLNPSLAALAPLYRNGQLAFVQAAGSPDNTRSHLDAALFWENGTPGNKRTTDGWLNRALSNTRRDDASLRAVSMTAELPRALYGTTPVVAITELQQLAFNLDQAPESADATLQAMRKMYANSDVPALRTAAEKSFAVSSALKNSQRQQGAYPAGSAFGSALRDIATLIKSDVGLQVAFAESRSGLEGKGSWDTHSYALDPAYQFGFHAVADDFSKSIAAFWEDLGAQRDNVMLVTHTDFGRNVVQNEKRGCDHGRATTMMVMGTQIKPGMHGHLPQEFARETLEDHMDLPVTTDYRSVLAAVAGMQLGIPAAQDRNVFPGFTERRLDLARS